MKTPFSFFVSLITINALLSLVSSQSTDSCNSNLNLNNQVPFDTRSLNCFPVWNTQDYILRHGQAARDTWSFLLSAPDTDSYIAIGFSSNGLMVGSSAIVGWLDGNGNGMARQYTLGGQMPSQVVVDRGGLKLVDNSTAILSESSRLYLAFQLQATTQPSTRVLYAVGPSGVKPAAPGYTLAQHINMVSTTLNYVTGQVNDVQSPYTRLRRAHGVFNMIGWGILMLMGMMAARYFKQHDPLWFYTHISIQAAGFTLGMVGVICGFILEDKLSSIVDKHKGLGITILVLGCFQAMAFLARPEKGSRYRQYWNWYHHSIGRLVIIFAISNVFYGIHLGGEGASWSAGYGVVIGLLFSIAIVLEVRKWMRRENIDFHA